MTDENDLIGGLFRDGKERQLSETALHTHFLYLIRYGVWRHRLPKDVCESIYSDTMYVVINNIRQGKFEKKASLETYINSIFDHKCIDAVRSMLAEKNKTLHHSVDIEFFTQKLPDSARSIIEALIRKEDIDKINKNREELGENCRQLLFFFEEDKKDTETAQLMGFKSAEVVKTTRLRCMEKLRQKVLNIQAK